MTKTNSRATEHRRQTPTDNRDTYVQCGGAENDGHENDGHEFDRHEIDRHEIDGHENAGHVSGV